MPLAAGQLQRALAPTASACTSSSRDASATPTFALKTLSDRRTRSPKLETFSERRAKLRAVARRKKLMVRKAKEMYVVDVGAKAPTEIAKSSRSAQGLVVQLRSARRMAADVRRGVAARARLLLRPRHARRRLAGDSRASTLPLVDRVTRSRRAGRRRRADGRRALGAAHLRPRRRCAPRRGRRAAGVARRDVSSATRRPAAYAWRTSTERDPDIPDDARAARASGRGRAKKATSSPP